MFGLKSHFIILSLKNMYIMRSMCTSRLFVEQLNKRALLKLSGPDTNNYLQSMITNDIKNIDNSPAIFSLLLNARGLVLYDILLYKINSEEYFVEYESSAVDYLHKHLLMYRLRKNVKIEPVKPFFAWVIHPESDASNSYSAYLKTVTDSLMQQNGIITAVVDPRTNLLGARVITTENFNLLPLLPQDNLKFVEGNSYRLYRYKLGIGEGVIDHPTGVCLPLDTNVDFLNGVSFSKGCYIGQELTARLHFTLNVKKRLMPIVLEPKSNYPEFPPECTIINEKDEKIGRLRSNLDQYGLALLKYEESLKANYLLIKDFDIKLKAIRPKWWPNGLDAKK